MRRDALGWPRAKPRQDLLVVTWWRQIHCDVIAGLHCIAFYRLQLKGFFFLLMVDTHRFAHCKLSPTQLEGKQCYTNSYQSFKKQNETLVKRYEIV